VVATGGLGAHCLRFEQSEPCYSEPLLSGSGQSCRTPDVPNPVGSFLAKILLGQSCPFWNTRGTQGDYGGGSGGRKRERLRAKET
jgi:hypothetical protein